MKNITLSADGQLIEAARERARSEVMSKLRGQLKVGRKLTRERW